jgi:drug/metabolite transporter (DMT)-like permease
MFCTLVQWSFCLVHLGGPRKTWGHMRAGGRLTVAGMLIMGCTQTCLSVAFMLTSSANALVIFSLHTVWCSFFLSDNL